MGLDYGKYAEPSDMMVRRLDMFARQDISAERRIISGDIAGRGQIHGWAGEGAS